MKQKIKQQQFKQEVSSGKIFIYPTDTLYGLGCDATNQQAVQRIKEIKQRDKDKPLSIIAPSFEWILKNFRTTKQELKKYLPGAYTLILKKKEANFLNWISNSETIGIRIPKNSFTEKIQKTGVPFVTTSVNLSGEPFALKIEDIKQEIKNKVDYIIEEDKNKPLSGIPSTLIINGRPLERK